MTITKELFENYMRNRLVEMSKDTASNIVPTISITLFKTLSISLILIFKVDL